MISGIRECDICLFRELYAVLAAFADQPDYTISRIGAGRISIPDDQSNDLHHFHHAILDHYPHAMDLEVIKVAAAINVILDRKSLGGKEFDEWFWTNKGFLQHPDWDTIREMARAFLLR